MEIGETLDPGSAADFAAWLDQFGGEKREIWVVIYKKASGRQTVTYEALVETALCYGWIDGLAKGMDGEKYAQRFSPRRPGSHWTAANRALAARLIADGRMTAAGRAALPAEVLGAPTATDG